MRSQQQADREEQQRIKNLVLNYEASTEPEPSDGDYYSGIFLPFLSCLPERHASLSQY